MTEKRCFDNGLRLVLAPGSGLRSVATGIWTLGGSRYETLEEAGAAHFIEHMFFKGTARRAPYQIALETNTLGSQINAFTAQEAVCVYGRVIDEKIEHAVDLLCDLVANSTFAPEELDRERNVILEEVMMYEDTPDERVSDLFAETLWEGHALGRPVLGNEETLRRMDAAALRRFQKRCFGADRTIVAVAGSFDPDRVDGLIRERLGGLQSAEALVAGPSPAAVAGARYIERDLEQTHFCCGTPGPCRSSDERYSLAVLNLILGGGMSSRLFQEAREKRGLAYAIGSYANGFHDTGYIAISGGATPESLEELLDVCWRETRRIYTDDVTQDELRNAKDMMRASLLLSLENTSASMTRIAEQEIYLGRFVPVEEMLAEVEKVTVASVRACAERYLKGQPVASAFIGPAVAKAATLGRERF